MKASTYPKLVFRPDSALLAKFHFDGSAVYRKVNGKLRTLQFAVGGTVYTTVDGARITGKELAWALHFGNWPMYDLWQADGNMYNFAISNLIPVRGIKLRCRIKRHEAGKYSHGLTETLFLRKEDAETTWRAYAKDIYNRDRAYCLEQERAARDGKFVPVVAHVNVEIVPELNLPDIEPYIGGYDPRKVPKVAPNAKAHWYKGQWIVVNRPKGVWDDYHLRCAAALKFLQEGGDYRSEPVRLFEAVPQDALPVG